MPEKDKNLAVKVTEAVTGIFMPDDSQSENTAGRHDSEDDNNQQSAVSHRPTQAADGEHHVFFLSSGEVTEIKSSDSYLGVDLVAVSVNKEKSWLKSKTAVGSVDISIRGRETINRLIGPYDMEHGAKLAPQFDIPLLDDQPYNDDPIKIEIKLRAIEKGTQLLDMLRAVIDWGNEAGGTYLPLLVPGLTLATAAAAPIEAANKKLMGSLSQFIFNNDKEEPIFNPQTGIVCYIRPQQIKSSQHYVLFHRGANLRRRDLTIIEEGTDVPMPSFVGSDDSVLEDGAWVLLRIRRHSDLQGTRPWDDAKRTLKNELRRLEEKIQQGDLTAKQALSTLMPDPTGRTNLYSAYSFLYQVILNDPALTEDDANRRAQKLAEHFNVVKERISKSTDPEDAAASSRNSAPKQLTAG